MYIRKDFNGWKNMAKIEGISISDFLTAYQLYVRQLKDAEAQETNHGMTTHRSDLGAVSNNTLDTLIRDNSFSACELTTYIDYNDFIESYKKAAKGGNISFPYLLCGIRSHSNYIDDEFTIIMGNNDRRVSMKIINPSDEYQCNGKKKVFGIQSCDEGVYIVDLSISHDIDGEIYDDPTASIVFYPNECFQDITSVSLDEAKRDFFMDDSTPSGFYYGYGESKCPSAQLKAEEVYELVNRLFHDGPKTVYEAGSLTVNRDPLKIGSQDTERMPMCEFNAPSRKR